MASNGFGDQVLAMRRKREGAHTGEITSSLVWNDQADLDLHVEGPCGCHIYFGQKKCGTCGGWLDVDMNSEKTSLEPVENVFFAAAPTGDYTVYVINYNPKGGDPDREIAFRCVLKRAGSAECYNGVIKGSRARITCFTFSHEGSGTPSCSVEGVAKELSYNDSADAAGDSEMATSCVVTPVIDAAAEGNLSASASRVQPKRTAATPPQPRRAAAKRKAEESEAVDSPQQKKMAQQRKAVSPPHSTPKPAAKSGGRGRRGGAKLASKVICLSGRLSLKHSDVASKIEAAGGVVARSVTQQCTHLVYGKNAEGTRKYTAAQGKQCELTTEDAFNAML